MTRQNLIGDFRFWRVPALPHIELLQVGNVSFSYPMHIHDAHSVGEMLHGVERVIVNDRTHVARPNDVLLINADEPHANESVRASYRVIKFAPEVLRDFAREVARGEVSDVPFRMPVVRDALLSRSVRRFFRAVDDDVSDLEQESSFLSLLALLLDRQLRLKVSRPGRVRRPVGVAREFLRAHYAENVSLATLGRAASVSGFHLLRTFRDQIGISPHEYQMQLRVGAARKLLRADHAIADVAARTGFYDQSHLSRHFKRIVHMTPGEYALHSKIVQDGSALRALRHGV